MISPTETASATRNRKDGEVNSDSPIVHLCHWDPKFIPQVINFINTRFSPTDHRFLILGKAEPLTGGPENQRTLGDSDLSLRGLLALREQLAGARRIIVHGLFNNRIAGVLSTMPNRLPDCRWVLWGGDLYNQRWQRRNARWYFATLCRKRLCARLGGIATLIPGDVEIARAWLGFRGQHFSCLGYPSNVFEPSQSPNDSPNGTTVLVGNSATPSNRHARAFELLALTGRTDFRVLCPLSYGDPSYAAEVEAAGLAFFGNRFLPLRRFMTLQEYNRQLDGVTVAVFAHNRQQAVGNCIQLLGRGIRLHLDSQASHYSYFRSAGFPVGSLDDLNLAPLGPPHQSHCQALAEDLFSASKLESQYRDLFA